ncbi:MAG: glycosyltransferase family 1 protein [Chloroflexota bacterium]|nr:glycosyltransferase family 4 protein [Dehalococcoidia bacterium]MDW8254705.1 glycosyltransferase family 1 protein [Chloroflexota bacterium]
MEIAIDVQSTLGQRTGIGQYTARLVEALRRTAPELLIREVSAGRDLVMRTDRRLWWQQLELPRRATGADLLHVPGFDAPARAPCPVVLTVHDLIGALFPKILPPVSRLYWARWLPFTLRFADAIIADSEATRRDILRLTAVRAPIAVVPLGVDPLFSPPPPERVAAVRARYGLAEPFLLSVGTLEPRKGIDTLVDALALLEGRAVLALAGKVGWNWERVAARVARHGLGARVRRLGYVPDEDLPALYAAAEAFVLPSRYEGFGLPVLEAMACGAAVVTTTAGALPEVAGDAALLIPPDDPPALAAALSRLLADGALRAALQARGRARAAGFTWDRTARETVAVYRAVLDDGVSRGRRARQSG